MQEGPKSRGTSILVTQKWNRIVVVVVVVVVSCLPRLAWMVTWECNCMMMMKKARKSCRPGWLGWSPGSATA